MYIRALDDAFHNDKARCDISSMILAEFLQEKFGISFLTRANRTQLLAGPQEQQAYVEFISGYHDTDGTPEIHNWLELQVGDRRYYIDAVFSSLWGDESDRLIVEEMAGRAQHREKYQLHPVAAVSFDPVSEGEDSTAIEQFLSQPLPLWAAFETGGTTLRDGYYNGFVAAIQSGRDTPSETRLKSKTGHGASAVLQTILPREGHGPDYILYENKPVHAIESVGEEKGTIVRWIENHVLYVRSKTGALRVYERTVPEGRDMTIEEVERFYKIIANSPDPKVQEIRLSLPLLDILRDTQGVSLSSHGDFISYDVGWAQDQGERFLLRANGRVEKLTGGVRHAALSTATPEEEIAFFGKIKLVVPYNQAIGDFYAQAMKKREKEK